MKKVLLIEGLVMTPALADDSSGWIRSSNSTYQYFSDSSASGIFFQMAISDDSIVKEAAEITLTQRNSDKCLNKIDGKRFRELVNVDHQEIKYIARCYSGTLLLRTETDEGAQYVVDRFNIYRKDIVTFTFKHKSKADFTFTAPKKGFEKFYAEVQIASKEALQLIQTESYTGFLTLFTKLYEQQLPE